MDPVAAYNIARWKALAAANALWTRPRLDLDVETARDFIDPEGQFGDLSQRSVLCLAGGGGQQSVAFALLGAQVTVVDLSQEQLERDRIAAKHYGVSLTLVPADMRDLSDLPGGSFDLVYQPHSLGFVPDCHDVFRQAARVLKPGGQYYFNCANPFLCGVTGEDWNGSGYTLGRVYTQGEAIVHLDPEWVYDRRLHSGEPIPGTRDFRQTLSHLFNGLVSFGFIVERLSENKDITADAAAEPGSWNHLVAYAPPWLAFWSRYRPDQHGG